MENKAGILKNVMWTLIVGCGLFPSTSIAQTDSSVVKQEEHYNDVRIDSLIDKHKRINQQVNGTPGYRVQIHFGADQVAANKVRADFLDRYPDTQAHTSWEPPNFRIRVGDFRNQFEAEAFKKTISAVFPYAFTVKDIIDLPPVEVAK